PGRPRRYVEEEEEPEVDPGGNLWVHMLQQQRAMLQQQQEMHHQYQEQQAQAERQHREMMQVLQQQRTEQPPVQPQPNQGVQPQAPRGNPIFREFCRLNPPTFEGQYEPTE
ncbi:hypothetical protein A2U01_0065787, partial [Trifolium medium]|nr:hypothetical protein [Trifolium medium]